MPLNDDLLVELLDGEVPTAYRKAMEQRVSSDPHLASRLKAYRFIKKSMRTDDETMASAYQKSGDYLKEQLFSSLHVLQLQHQLQPGEVPRGRWQIFSVRWIPAAAALLLAFFMVANIGNRVVFQVPSAFTPVDSTELIEYDQELVDLLSVNREQVQERVVSDDGINLHVGVQDMEQLFMFLEKTRTLNGSINNLIIQLPEIDTFELLGESQLKRIEKGD